MQEQVKDATIFGGIYLDRYGREKPLLQKYEKRYLTNNIISDILITLRGDQP